MKGFVKFIKAAGIPDLTSEFKGHIDVSELTEIAVTNKLQPLLPKFLGEGEIWLSRYDELHSLLVKIGESLEGLNYSIVKTLRPVPHLPSDVDIIIDSSDFDEACQRLIKGKFRVLDKCPYGVTFNSFETRFNVDLSEELTVAGLKYVDRNLILEESIEHNMNGTNIKIPKPYVDLLVIVDHSVFKEGIYTLRDFYTTILWRKYLPRTLHLASKESDAVAMQLFLAVTYLICREAIGEHHIISRELAKALQKEPKGDVQNVPYRYRFVDLIVALASKVTYFSKEKRLQGLLRSAPSTKNARLFANYLVRKSY